MTHLDTIAPPISSSASRIKPVKPADLEAPGYRTYPGIVRWIARTDLVKRGYQTKTARLWSADSGQDEPTRAEWEGIAKECGRLQREMLAWARSNSATATTVTTYPQVRIDQNVVKFPDAIADPDAAKIAHDAIRAIRAISDPYVRMEALTNASRRLDQFTQSDALDFIHDVAIQNLGLDPDDVQAALANGQHLRHEDRADEIGQDTTGTMRQTSKPSRQPKGQRRNFKLVPFAAVQVSTDPAYLIKGLIPREGLTIVWGPPKCGKSFWMFDTAMHIVLGWRYRGRNTMQGPVVYLALEGGHGFRARIEAFRKRNSDTLQNVPDIPFYLITDLADLVADHAALVEDIRQHLGFATNPVLVIIDTLNRSLVGSENKPEDMAAYVRAADAIREAFKCAVVVVHHCGVDEKRPRGHTSLTGAADAQLAIIRDAANNIIVKIEWMKDGPEGDTIVSRLDPETVGHDSDGEPITSCVVVPVEDNSAARPATTRKLSDRQRLALDAMAHCAAKPPPSSFGLPEGQLTIDDWRNELYRRGILDRDAKNPRTDFRRLRDSLMTRGAIGERDGIVWAA